jgi:hypothetical protein
MDIESLKRKRMTVIARFKKGNYNKTDIDSFKRKGIKYLIFRLKHIGWEVSIIKDL